MIDRQKYAVEAGMVSRSSAPSSGGSLPSVRHLTHHPYTELLTVYTHSHENARKIIPQDIDPTVDYIPQDDV